MHMKAAVIDGETLVLGSMNWTRAGEDTNDENTLIVRSRGHSAMFQEYFDRLWDSIPDRWSGPNMRPDPESKDSGNSCNDGVDNDFDTLIDRNDPGCSEDPPPLAALPPQRLSMKGSSKKPPKSHRLYRHTICDPSYPDWYVCIPIKSRSGDMNCAQLPYRAFRTNSPDSHYLDGNKDGIACINR